MRVGVEHDDRVGEHLLPRFRFKAYGLGPLEPMDQGLGPVD